MTLDQLKREITIEISFLNMAACFNMLWEHINR